VSFTEWTPDGHIRHPTFRGMRKDKPAKSIRRELEGGRRNPYRGAKRRVYSSRYNSFTTNTSAIRIGPVHAVDNPSARAIIEAK